VKTISERYGKPWLSALVSKRIANCIVEFAAAIGRVASGRRTTTKWRLSVENSTISVTTIEVQTVRRPIEANTRSVRDELSYRL
jgi:hypothetical protein